MQAAARRLRDVAMAVVDAACSVLPEGLARGIVRLGAQGEWVVATEVSAELPAGVAPTYLGPWNLEPTMPRTEGEWSAQWLGALNASLTRLRDDALGAGARFDYEQLSLSFRDGGVALAGVDAHGGETPIAVLDARDRAMRLLHPDLHRLLSSFADLWRGQVGALQRAVGTPTGWSWDADGGQLVLETAAGQRRFAAQLLGSFSPALLSWCWSWSNASYERADYAKLLPFRDAARSMRGLGAVVRPGFFCDESFAAVVARLVAAQSGAFATFRARSEALNLHFALFDPR